MQRSFATLILVVGTSLGTAALPARADDCRSSGNRGVYSSGYPGGAFYSTAPRSLTYYGVYGVPAYYGYTPAYYPVATPFYAPIASPDDYRRQRQREERLLDEVTLRLLDIAVGKAPSGPAASPAVDSANLAADIRALSNSIDGLSARVAELTETLRGK